MSQISLTAPMRSNLLSLQNIASQQDIVQNRLATGLKVSSAIDNPSAYYTAASLSNRAADLTALLDAMSQGVQTIKTASEAIDSATKFLEQAKATANQALETAVPAKEWFAGQVGENGAVVETEAELRQAIADNKEMICVYGQIDLGDISTEGGLILRANQKLVGVGYFGDFSNQHSQIKATATGARHMIVARNNCLISDLRLDYANSAESGDSTVINSGASDNLTIRNLDIKGVFSDKNPRNHIRGGLWVSNCNTTILGAMNFEISGLVGWGMYLTSGSADIAADTVINIKTSGQDGYGIYNAAETDIRGTLNIETNSGAAVINCSTLNIHSSTRLDVNVKMGTAAIRNFKTDGRPCTLAIDSGVNFGLTQGGVTKYYQTTTAYRETTTTSSQIDFDNIEIKLPTEKTSAWKTSKTQNDSDDHLNNAVYLQIIEQYNQLTTDSSYKGVNLLSGQSLKINFNEDRSSKIDIAGVKADSNSLGIATTEWENAGDIEQSISELENAINMLRGFASEFGNYYSIVTTRQDFTENLINVLEEGADKLTLADMNEESANMLALQTSQQLAINSLSLASQAAQSVLKLF